MLSSEYGHRFGTNLYVLYCIPTRPGHQKIKPSVSNPVLLALLKSFLPYESDAGSAVGPSRNIESAHAPTIKLAPI